MPDDADLRRTSPADPVQPCPLQMHWIEIQMVGEDGFGLADQAYSITLPNGEERTGLTDANGLARIDGIPGGQCKVRWTDLDREAWEEL